MALRKSLETISDIIVCSQIGSKWNTMFESYVDDWTSFDFWFIFFFKQSAQILLLLISIYCFTNQAAITWSRRWVLNFKLLVCTFLRLISCLISIKQKLCKEKNFNLNLCWMLYHVSIMVKAVRNSGIRWLALIMAWYSTWAIWEWQSWATRIFPSNRPDFSLINFKAIFEGLGLRA